MKKLPITTPQTVRCCVVGSIHMKVWRQAQDSLSESDSLNVLSQRGTFFKRIAKIVQIY